jgi:hypothetical protein
MGSEPLAILERFPGQSHLLTLRMAEDPEFYALCQDHEICIKALTYWSSSNKPEADARLTEYRVLVRDLEAEIAAELDLSSAQRWD